MFVLMFLRNTTFRNLSFAGGLESKESCVMSTFSLPKISEALIQKLMVSPSLLSDRLLTGFQEVGVLFPWLLCLKKYSNLTIPNTFGIPCKVLLPVLSSNSKGTCFSYFERNHSANSVLRDSTIY